MSDEPAPNQPLPADADEFPSNVGTSVGHWEGCTLIVETAGLNPFVGPLTIGRHAQVVERIALKDPTID